jgi:hypothetical protein
VGASLTVERFQKKNNHVESLLTSHGTILCLTCPYTSQQKGNAEHAILMFHKCIMRTLMFHAQIPKSFWADALATATYLLNRCRSKTIGSLIPYMHLHGRSPPYDTIWVFGCLCYPNIASTAVHKLCPSSMPCVFLGYPPQHRGDRCYDTSTVKILISHHVMFYETNFPFQQIAAMTLVVPASPHRLDFHFTDLRSAATSPVPRSANMATPSHALPHHHDRLPHHRVALP